MSIGNNNGNMNLVQQMLMKRQMEQTKTPQQDDNPVGAIGDAAGVPGLGMIPGIVGKIEAPVNAMARAPVTAMEQMGNVLSGMRDLPKPAAAGHNPDIKSMLQGQIMGGGGMGKLGPLGPDDVNQPRPGAEPDPMSPEALLAAHPGIGGSVGPNAPSPASTTPPPPAAPSAVKSTTGDVVQDSQNGPSSGPYSPNIRSPRGVNPQDEAKRRAMMAALGGGF